MEYYTIIGLVVAAVIVIFGFLVSFKNGIKNELKPMEELNLSITKLNLNFEHMMESDDVRDKRISKHGEQIDEIKEQQKENEKVLGNHEQRIKFLEEK